MQKWIAVVILLIGFGVRAQITNSFATELENFEAQTNTIILKAYGPVGTASVSSQTLSIFCKETTDISHGGKMFGVALELEDSRPRQISIVDEDEMMLLVNALDYLSKMGNDVTTLPSFDAEYATKCGLRFGAHSARKQGGLVYYFQINGGPRMPLECLSPRLRVVAGCG